MLCFETRLNAELDGFQSAWGLKWIKGSCYDEKKWMSDVAEQVSSIRLKTRSNFWHRDAKKTFQEGGRK